MRKLLPAVVLASLVLGACTAKTPTIVPSGPAGSSTASPSPSPSATKKQPTARKVVYVLGNGLYVYDVKTDTSTKVATGQDIKQPRWLTDDEVSFVQGASLRTLNITSRDVADVLSLDARIEAYAWTPDRETVATLIIDRDYPKVEFHSLVGDRPVLIAATMEQAPGREFTYDDQVKIEFDRTGSFALIVYTPASKADSADTASLQIRSLGGDLLYGAPTGDPTMGTILPNGKAAYFRASGSARVWDASKDRVSGVRGGGRWFHPWPSRDSKQIAYDTGVTADARVKLLTLSSGAVRDIGPRGRIVPVIASTKVIWAQSVRKCTGECPYFDYQPGKTVYAIDIKSGKETETQIGSLVDADVWYA